MRIAAVIALGVIALAVAGLLLEGSRDPDVPAAATPLEPDHIGRSPTALPATGPLTTMKVGHGATAAVVMFRGPRDLARPGVVFLHGWGVPTRRYRPWLRHLADRGNVVIAPSYQRDEHAAPDTTRPAAIRGLRSALERVSVSPGSLVFSGHSAGGALAADLAGVASHSAAIPAPVAIYAVYPGRAIIGTPGIPEESLASLPRATKLLVLAGVADTVVGTAPAYAMANAASSLVRRNRRVLIVRRPEVADHYAPTRSTRLARRTFWRRLDSLAAQAR